MAGFDYSLGRSNNMVAAEEEGKITIGRWAKRHGVSARAATEIMQPYEAHHTGTGRRGKTRLTPVMPASLEPTAEQLAAMKAWDAGERPAIRGWYIVWKKQYTGRYGRRKNVPTIGIYNGDPASAPKRLRLIEDDDEWKAAQEFAGRDLKPYAETFHEVI